MGCNIYIRKNLIIDCSVGMFETMYHVFDECAEQNNLYNNTGLKSFLHEMFIAKESRCSYGFDFADYTDDPQVINLLLLIIDQSMPELKRQLKNHAIANIIKLRNKLVDYHEQLR